jgi:hypothetical protein
MTLFGKVRRAPDASAPLLKILFMSPGRPGKGKEAHSAPGFVSRRLHCGPR